MTTDDGRPDSFTDDGALFGREEVRVQSRQVTGQLDVWDVLQDVCAEHGAGCTSLLCVL